MSKTDHQLIDGLRLETPIMFSDLFQAMQAAREDERADLKRIIEDRIAEIDRTPMMSAGADRKRELNLLLNKLK